MMLQRIDVSNSSQLFAGLVQHIFLGKDDISIASVTSVSAGVVIFLRNWS